MKRVRSKCGCGLPHGLVPPGDSAGLDGGIKLSTPRRRHLPNYSAPEPPPLIPAAASAPVQAASQQILAMAPRGSGGTEKEDSSNGEFDRVVMPAANPAPPAAVQKCKITEAYAYLLQILQYAFGCIHDLAGFFQSKNVKTEITFGKLHEYLKTVPGILSCMHMRLTNHFQYPVESITLLLEGLQEFVFDPDIAEASIGDFNKFAKSSYNESIVPILHGVTWIEELLCQFKRFVSNLWVKMKKISSPCQFGAKSKTMYLCMECMTEHF